MTNHPPMRDVTEIDVGAGYPCYRVTDPAALIQVVGWLKSTGTYPSVYFRGQQALYGGRLVPSGFRNGGGTSGEKGVLNHDREITRYLDSLWGAPCTCTPSGLPFAERHNCRERAAKVPSLYRGTRRACVEPLLQHYGLRTRWVDLVDNLWIALWFASHEYVLADGGRFAYVRPRLSETSDVAYVIVLDLGPLAETAVPGYWTGSDVRLIDLRYSVPSIYVRPHAQHGLLVAPRGPISGKTTSIVESHIRAAIQIDLVLARKWLGNGSMTSAYALFPPAVRDEGYRRLLRFAPEPPASLGAFTSMGISA